MRAPRSPSSPGRHLKKVVLELGGSDPFIVLSTDDLDAVVASAFDARFDNNGQSCNAAKRFVVIDSLYDEFAEKLTAKMAEVEVGDPSSDDTVLGPLSSELAAVRIEDQVQRALAAGATTRLAPRPRDGAKFSPVVLEGITPDNPAFREEFFGPVASLYRVGSEQEAIELANATDFGLGSYVWTTDREQALRIADRLEAGMVYVTPCSPTRRNCPSAARSDPAPGGRWAPSASRSSSTRSSSTWHSL